MGWGGGVGVPLCVCLRVPQICVAQQTSWQCISSHEHYQCWLEVCVFFSEEAVGRQDFCSAWCFCLNGLDCHFRMMAFRKSTLSINCV